MDIQNGSGIIRIEASEYRGELGLDIRRYYWREATDTEPAGWAPTRKGIRIAEHMVEEVLSAMVFEAGI